MRRPAADDTDVNAPIYLALLAAALPSLRARLVAYVDRSVEAALAPEPAPRPRLQATLGGCRREAPRRRPAHRPRVSRA